LLHLLAHPRPPENHSLSEDKAGAIGNLDVNIALEPCAVKYDRLLGQPCERCRGCYLELHIERGVRPEAAVYFLGRGRGDDHPRTGGNAPVELEAVPANPPPRGVDDHRLQLRRRRAWTAKPQRTLFTQSPTPRRAAIRPRLECNPAKGPVGSKDFQLFV